jgi:hypothetical protein
MQASVETYVKERAQRRFDSEGDDVSGRWAALRQATIDIRTEAGYSAGPINVRTGALEDYITNSEGAYLVEGGDALMVYPGRAPGSASNETGSLAAKLVAAQQGLADPYTPARPVIGMNESDALAITLSLEAFLVGV